MTSDLSELRLEGETQIITEATDILDTFATEEILEAAQQPQAIRTALQMHQKQALKFALRREMGWTMDCTVPDVWAHSATSGFVNRITGADQRKEPDDFRGGVIADPMGLGKTLSMISLIAMDIEFPRDESEANRTTLVVVPPSLIASWQEQFDEHVHPKAIKVMRHHGTQKLTAMPDPDSVAVVMTTYHTVASDFRHVLNRGTRSILHSIPWRRIILDEAHHVRNAKCQTSQAVFALNATSRWAITGTPLQNGLSDLASILTFLRLDPYCRPRAFDADVVLLWKQGRATEAVDRLQRLMQCIVLRRPKHIITLPTRTDLKIELVFSEEERCVYEQARAQAAERVRQALLQADALKTAYFNALQQIDALRRICNLGCHYKAKHRAQAVGMPNEDWHSAAQSNFDLLVEFGNAVCHKCNFRFNLADDQSVQAVRMNGARISECSNITCGACFNTSGSNIVCTCGASCKTSVINTDGEPDPGRSVTPILSSGLAHPTKVGALVLHLQRLDYSEKSLVFSFWTTTLDLIEPALNTAQIGYVRFDGKTSHRKRKEVIKQFRTDPSKRVMLITLSCGAAGLNLTAASRVFLMEPHWNPSVEEQALARVHRIGQTREVTTMRFTSKIRSKSTSWRLKGSNEILRKCSYRSPDRGSMAKRLNSSCSEVFCDTEVLNYSRGFDQSSDGWFSIHSSRISSSSSR